MLPYMLNDTNLSAVRALYNSVARAIDIPEADDTSSGKWTLAEVPKLYSQSLLSAIATEFSTAHVTDNVSIGAINCEPKSGPLPPQQNQVVKLIAGGELPADSWDDPNNSSEPRSGLAIVDPRFRFVRSSDQPELIHLTTDTDLPPNSREGDLPLSAYYFAHPSGVTMEKRNRGIWIIESNETDRAVLVPARVLFTGTRSDDGSSVTNFGFYVPIHDKIFDALPSYPLALILPSTRGNWSFVPAPGDPLPVATVLDFVAEDDNSVFFFSPFSDHIFQPIGPSRGSSQSSQSSPEQPVANPATGDVCGISCAEITSVVDWSKRIRDALATGSPEIDLSQPANLAALCAKLVAISTLADHVAALVRLVSTLGKEVHEFQAGTLGELTTLLERSASPITSESSPEKASGPSVVTAATPTDDSAAITSIVNSLL